MDENKLVRYPPETYLNLFSGVCSLKSDLWGYSSAGRAPALQAGGQEFDSLYLHQDCGNRKLEIRDWKKQFRRLKPKR